MMLTLSLEVNNLYRTLDAPEEATKRLLKILHSSGRFPISGGDLSVAFVSDEQIAQIHNDHIGDPTPTDVITFPANNDMGSAGEIIISVDRARSCAEELNVPFTRELCLYLIHGWLHLASYDDKDEPSRTKMREAEQEALEILEESDQQLEFTLSKI